MNTQASFCFFKAGFCFFNKGANLQRPTVQLQLTDLTKSVRL